MSILPPRFWRQLISWSYCAASWTFVLVAWRNSNEKVSLSCNQRAARSVVVMLQVWYAIAFRFNSHLGEFLFCLVKKLVDVSGDPRECQWLHQRLSLAVVKGNAVSWPVSRVCEFDLTLRVLFLVAAFNVLITITAYHLPMYHCVAIAF